MLGSAASMTSLLVALALTQAPKLASPGWTAVEVNPEKAQFFSLHLAAALRDRGLTVITAQDISALLGVERQKQLLGCGDEASSCMAEIASALGAPYVMSGSLTKLEGIFQLNLQVMDSGKARTIGRATKIARDFEGLRALIPWAVAEACGTPLPPAPSRVLPVTLIATGGAAFIGGGVLGLIALNAEATTLGELRADDGTSAVTLNQDAAVYRERLAQTALQRTLALTALLSGAALVGLGVFLMPPEAPQPGVRAILVPTLTGAAVSGVFP